MQRNANDHFGLIEKWFIYVIIFLTGYEFLVPVDVSALGDDISVTLPFWAGRMEVIHGVFVKDAFFIFYVLIFIFLGFKSIPIHKSTATLTLLVIALAIVGMCSAVINNEGFIDILESFRLVLFAIFFMCIVHWSNILGSITILRVFLFGVFISNIINLYFTFTQSFRLMGVLPMLLGQNGPGGAMGFLVSFAAWLYLISKSKSDRLFSIVFTLVGAFTLVISFSKLGMLMGTLGICSWGAVLLKGSSTKQVALTIVTTICFVFCVGLWLNTAERGKEVMKSVELFYFYKFGAEGSGLVDEGDGGDTERIYYFIGVGEIFLAHPILGVSYSGFGKALLETKANETGKLPVEENSAGANPHNAFLYYISANGLFGLILTTSIFLSFLIIMAYALYPEGVVGIFIWGCILGVSIVHTNTLPSFFNTGIMYVPAAIALSLVLRKMKISNVIDGGEFPS